MAHFDQTIQVHWRFPVRFTRGVFAPGNAALGDLIMGDRPRLLAYIDANLVAAQPALPAKLRLWAETHPHGLELALVRELPGGEAVKNDPDIIPLLATDARDYHLCRHSYVLAIGGGALLDAVGYAAATIHRGCRLIRLPSTVLAQNDSGMGVKNGINFMGLKNFLGTFSPPAGVVCDFDLLSTLPWRIWVSGIAEAFKVGIISPATPVSGRH
jgi:3-dehydroquinate synthase